MQSPLAQAPKAPAATAPPTRDADVLCRGGCNTAIGSKRYYWNDANNLIGECCDHDGIIKGMEVELDAIRAKAGL